MVRRLLYPEQRTNRMLRERYVLHREAVRPVPVVTIDFGDGRRLVRTLTGDSVHLVLDPSGRPVGAMPGLVLPDVFVQWLERRLALARCDREELAVHHERWCGNRLRNHAVVEGPVLRARNAVDRRVARRLDLSRLVSHAS